ncbi:conserved hypothetical protein [Candidatus Desulfarcum epimagneticum]|uniref:Uncharacterized protein n=1 Tax=uncultured Desulfobacteraceae bacterium TaxID=218296 RepID=A0A484HFZ5_9BACT|nr:conserved hypothetical protein [uncultured Desulfobacteraceae bacterium]
MTWHKQLKMVNTQDKVKQKTPVVNRQSVKGSGSRSDLKIEPGEIHLWLAFPDEMDPRLVSACEALLSENERARMERFRFEKDRRLCLAARALARMALAGYAGRDPREIRFQENRWGKPRIAGPKPMPPLRFNLSHTDGLVLFGATLENEIGVDVERLDRENMDMKAIARRFFSPPEAAHVARSPRERRAEVFFRLWTLKEAFIKARGRGLSIPLDSFYFNILKKKEIQVCFPDCGQDSEEWLFFTERPAKGHMAGVAVQKKGGPAPALQIKKALPGAFYP